MKNNEVILHGEAMIFPISKIPSDAKGIKASNESFHIIADSESTGNHHVIDSKKNVEFFVGKDGVMYMNAKEPTSVYCVHADRHSPIEIPAGTYEFGIQQEYDPFSEEIRKVRD